MGAKKKAQPSEAELAILRTLWSEGASSVREVHELLGGDERTRYTTTLKLMQRMAEKGLVRRDASQRSHVYTAAVEEEEVERALVSSFVNRMFEGSVQKLVLHALETGDVSDEGLVEIKRQLKRWEKRK
jgi:BlaI family transcriptional regulator, penicillinase repressor